MSCGKLLVTVYVHVFTVDPVNDHVCMLPVSMSP